MLRRASSLSCRVASLPRPALPRVLRHATPALAHLKPNCATRHLCTAPTDRQADEQPELLFYGGKNLMVKRLKQASVLNLGFALSAAPVLHYLTSLSGAPGKGIAMSAVLIFFGGGTTGMLTWISSTYVLTMKPVAGRDALLVETPTFFGGIQATEVPWADIQQPGSYHPFCTFQAGGKLFYLDEGGEMHDEKVQARLEEILSTSVMAPPPPDPDETKN